jgi:hypothetical protein
MNPKCFFEWDFEDRIGDMGRLNVKESSRARISRDFRDKAGLQLSSSTILSDFDFSWCVLNVRLIYSYASTVVCGTSLYGGDEMELMYLRQRRERIGGISGETGSLRGTDYSCCKNYCP